jgi:hypothetical protein
MPASRTAPSSIGHSGCRSSAGSLRGTIFTTVVLLTLFACSRQAPTPAVAGQSSLSFHGTGTATLSWERPRRNEDGSGIVNLAGYFIYYGTDPTKLNGTIRIPDPYVTTYTVDGLGPGTYYFRVEAFTAQGIRSSASPTVSKTIH